MDTTEQNIKMCDCEEIQGQKSTFGVGDFLVFRKQARQPSSAFLARYNVTQEGLEVIIGDVVLCVAKPFPKTNQDIWLPRQDQLQAMLIESTKLESWRLNIVFMDWQQNEFTYDEHGSPHWKHGPYNSMEQLWLAFCMSEKYGKVWNGTGWVKRS